MSRQHSFRRESFKPAQPHLSPGDSAHDLGRVECYAEICVGFPKPNLYPAPL